MLATQIHFPKATSVDDSLLYGSSDPQKNLAIVRARQMSPDELKSAGYRDGLHRRGLRGSLSDYPAYLEGWSLGDRDRLAATV